MHHDEGLGPRLLVHEPVYFSPHQKGNCESARYESPDHGADAGRDHSLPYAEVGMCRRCGRRGIAVEAGHEDDYLTGRYSRVILDGYKHKSVSEVEDALRALGKAGT